jgi:short-subunit dehydrogenase
MRHLEGKNAILTRASRGIGAAVAHSLGREGVNLALVARSSDGLLQTAHTLSETRARVLLLPTDITGKGAPETVVRQARKGNAEAPARRSLSLVDL